MNEKQIAYQKQSISNSIVDIFYLAVSVISGQISFNLIKDSIQEAGFSEELIHSNFFPGVMLAGLCLYTGFNGIKYANARLTNRDALKEIRANPRLYPLEFAESVVIDDEAGLDFLVSKTEQRSDIEWATFLKARDDKSRAVVYDFLDVEAAKELDLVKKATSEGMRIDRLGAIEKGYNGLQHYHPDGEDMSHAGRNFSVSMVDRNVPKDWINLLTFNLPKGPEIIGYNKQFTYIPSDSSRRELVRATPEQIMEYLS